MTLSESSTHAIVCRLELRGHVRARSDKHDSGVQALVIQASSAQGLGEMVELHLGRLPSGVHLGVAVPNAFESNAAFGDVACQYWENISIEEEHPLERQRKERSFATNAVKVGSVMYLPPTSIYECFAGLMRNVINNHCTSCPRVEGLQQSSQNNSLTHRFSALPINDCGIAAITHSQHCSIATSGAPDKGTHLFPLQFYM
mmetsp:Transcript_11345/g.19003  ORF Transcript_11345/g.19003 Transcript_11345/m.19003 type:complete len:201 (+) Transcript_11345:475-1077(+)